MAIDDRDSVHRMVAEALEADAVCELVHRRSLSSSSSSLSSSSSSSGLSSDSFSSDGSERQSVLSSISSSSGLSSDSLSSVGSERLIELLQIGPGESDVEFDGGADRVFEMAEPTCPTGSKDSKFPPVFSSWPLYDISEEEEELQHKESSLESSWHSITNTEDEKEEAAEQEQQKDEQLRSTNSSREGAECFFVGVEKSLCQQSSKLSSQPLMTNRKKDGDLQRLEQIRSLAEFVLARLEVHHPSLKNSPRSIAGAFDPSEVFAVDMRILPSKIDEARGSPSGGWDIIEDEQQLIVSPKRSSGSHCFAPLSQIWSVNTKLETGTCRQITPAVKTPAQKPAWSLWSDLQSRWSGYFCHCEDQNIGTRNGNANSQAHEMEGVTVYSESVFAPRIRLRL